MKTKLLRYFNSTDKAAVNYTKHSLEAVILLCVVLVIYISKLAGQSDLAYFRLLERAFHILDSAVYGVFIAVGFGYLADVVIKHDNLRKTDRR